MTKDSLRGTARYKMKVLDLLRKVYVLDEKENHLKMKIVAEQLKVTSLLFSVIGSTMLVNEVAAAKQSTKKITVAKKNGWVEYTENDSRYRLYYKQVNIYRYDSFISFSFDEKTNTSNYFQYNISFVKNFNKKISGTEVKLKKYHNILY